MSVIMTIEVSPGHKRRKEAVTISRNVIAELLIDVFDGEFLDTEITIKGDFAVAGCQRQEFLKKLAALIDEYRI